MGYAGASPAGGRGSLPLAQGSISRKLFIRVPSRKGDLRPDAAELLSILLLNPAITDAFCSDGERVDTLLIAMSQFRKRNPKDTGEDECMANIFDCAACAVLAGKGKKAFLNGQGVELMVRMLHASRLASYIPALAVLSSACTNQGDDGASLIASICCRLVESGALKFLFPALLGKVTLNVTNKKSKVRIGSAEEHILQIIASMAEHLLYESIHLRRFVAKFLEDGKIDRLVQLHSKYTRRLLASSRRVNLRLLRRKTMVWRCCTAGSTQA